jgi:hypothetical protein
MIGPPVDMISVAGDFAGTINWGKGPLTQPAGGPSSPYLLNLSAQATVMGYVGGNDAADNIGHATAIGMDGSFLLGTNEGTRAYDNNAAFIQKLGMLDTSAIATFNVAGNIFAAQVGAGGFQVNRMQPPIQNWLRGVTVNNAVVASQPMGPSQVVIAGNFTNTDFGWGPKTASGAVNNDAFVATYDPQSGAPIAFLQFGDPGNENVTGVAVDPGTGDIYLTGNFDGNIANLPACPQLHTNGQVDFFVIRLNADLSCVWAQSFGGQFDDLTRGIVIDGANKRLMVTGFANSSLSFNNQPPAGPMPLFLLELGTPNGLYRWSQTFGTPGVFNGGVEAIAMDPAANFVIAGTLKGTIDFGNGPFTAASPSVFVARFAPPP